MLTLKLALFPLVYFLSHLDAPSSYLLLKTLQWNSEQFFTKFKSEPQDFYFLHKKKQATQILSLVNTSFGASEQFEWAAQWWCLQDVDVVCRLEFSIQTEVIQNEFMVGRFLYFKGQSATLASLYYVVGKPPSVCLCNICGPCAGWFPTRGSLTCCRF